MSNDRGDNQQRRKSNEDNFWGTALSAAVIGGVGFLAARNFLQTAKPYFNGPYGRREVDIVSNEKDLKNAMQKLKGFTLMIFIDNSFLVNFFYLVALMITMYLDLIVNGIIMRRLLFYNWPPKITVR